MKYTISQQRLLGLVKKMINTVEPNFNDEGARTATYSNGDDTYIDYYDKDRKTFRDGRYKLFARYFVWTKELQLNKDLFITLDDFFGEDMTMIIDWFNEEFNQDAENITF